MLNSRLYLGLTTFSVAGLLTITTGCSNLPGSREQQGAVIGGLGGAAAGAAIGGEEHRLLGAILGGALGAGGGYVIGANSDRITGKDTSGAKEATQTAQTQPATADQAARATTADVNGDGFVTMDEVVAMQRAGFSESQMIERLRATGQVFELTDQQEQYLVSQGVSRSVVTQMQALNREIRDRLLQEQNSVIGRPAVSD
jgi:hypothetical protein